ncbi:hypothetical protein [Planctomycetes bacterium Pan216]|uniref:hypothetical protein n=1 Tax=Kolteria novifilia TaxID=2527975 RepID=UPI00119F8A3F
MIDLHAYIHRLQLHPLPTLETPVEPGSLLINPLLSRDVRVQEHVRRFLPSQPPEFWETERSASNLVPEPIPATFRADDDGGFRELGIRIDAGALPPATPISVSVTGVEGRTFAARSQRANRFALVTLLGDLRDDADRSRYLKDCWVVTEVYYVVDATFRIRTSTGNRPPTSATEVGIQVRGEGRVDWLDEGTFRITHHHAIPFAFGGFQVV